MSLYNIRGILTVPLRKRDNILRTDAAVYEGLYLKLQGKAGVEVVKVLGLDNTGVAVQRAQDNTEALEFNEGDTVQYVLTAAEIETQVASVTIRIDGALTYSDGKLEYPTVTWDELGATQFVGDFTNLVIGRDEQAYGCCDGNNDPAPLRPVPFYLTSLPYPIEVVETMGMGGEFSSFFMFIPPTDDMRMGGYLQQFDIVVTVAYRTYDFWTPERLKVQGSIVAFDMVVTTGYKTYNPPPIPTPPNSNSEVLVFGIGYITDLGLTVTTGYITYSNYATESLSMRGQLQDITLT